MNELLVADCVARSFDDRRVLTSATLRAVRGELRVVFGRNGIGKSTLLRIAAGLLTADSGVVHFAGESYTDPSFAQMARRGLFFLPDHDLLSNAFRVEHQLEMFRDRFDGRDVRESAERV